MKIIDQQLNIVIPNALYNILATLKENDKPSFLVGGCVRDALLGYSPKDIDVEVYNTNYENLSKILSRFGKVNSVGKSFGVVKLVDNEGNDYDFTLPREENRIGVNHTDFEVSFDENITPEKAALRRDFTINAIYYDPIERKIYDYYDGYQDLQNKTLRAVGEKFAEDSLRVLRGLQFSSRFGFDIEPKTAKMCATLKNDPLSKERVREEWIKFFIKGKYPEKLLQYLIDTEWIDLYPELKDLIGIQQEPDHHPEGVLENHVAATLSAAHKIAERENMNEEERLILMLSALCHDLGKPTTTKTIKDQGKQKIISHGHQIKGIEPTLSFLKRIGFGEEGNKKDNTFWSYKKNIADKVAKLVEFHMAHVSHKNWNPLQIAKAIYPATIKELSFVVEADISGRPPLKRDIPKEMKKWKEDAETLNVLNGKPVPVIEGKDIQHLPITGKEFSDVLNHVYEIQIKNAKYTKEQGLKEAEKFVRQKKQIVNGDMIKNILNIPPGPEYQNILNEAWEAQKQKQIKDIPSAEKWLSERQSFNYKKINSAFNLKGKTKCQFL